MTEEECLGVGFGLVGGDILDLGWVFVAVVVMAVDDLELEVGAVVRIVWKCLNGRLYFLWRLSQRSLEGNMSNVGRHPIGMVMRTGFLMEFFFGSSFLGKVTSSKKVAVIEIVVWVVQRVV